MEGSDANPIAVGIGELDLPRPRLFDHFDVELVGDRVDVVDVEVDERAWPGVAGVLREVQVDVTTPQEEVQREAISEAVLSDDRETEALVPPRRRIPVGDAKDRNERLSHVASVSVRGGGEPGGVHTGLMTEPSDADRTPDAEAEALPDEGAEAADEAALEAYDLDGDGRISLTEDVRAELGMIDAHAAEEAEKPGFKGKVAKAAHRLLDKLDND